MTQNQRNVKDEYEPTLLMKVIDFTLVGLFLILGVWIIVDYLITGGSLL